VDRGTLAGDVDGPAPGRVDATYLRFRLGSEHYVRDGHHRVSVARALGETRIDAEVVELRPLSGRERRWYGPARHR